jgi:hypothetical protein
MMSLAAQYCKELRRELRRHANFPPNRPVALGDYGVVRDDVFDRLGNVADLGIRFSTVDGAGQSTFQFKSQGSVDFELIAKGDVQPGGVPAVRAGLDMKFHREHAVFFTAAGCTVKAVANIAELGRVLIELLRQGRWESDYYVVTEVNHAERTTAVASGEKGSEIRLEADSPALEQIKLADASLSLHVKRSKSMALEIVTEEAQIPLMQLSRIRGLFRDEFRPEAVARAAEPADSFAFGPDPDTVPPAPLPGPRPSRPRGAGREGIARGGAGLPEAAAEEMAAAWEPESMSFLESLSTPSDFELLRAKKAYIPLLNACYALAKEEEYRIPDGYTVLGEVRVSKRQEESLEALLPEYAASVEYDLEATRASIADPSAFGFVVLEEETEKLIVAIRGTQTPAEWVKNFTAIPQPFSEVPGFGFVHLGFEQMWRRIRESVFEVLRNQPPERQITLLGHSLGGAMATLGAVSVSRNLNRSKVDLCTFGGPRAGQVRFRINFNKLIKHCFRVVNQGDIVPHVPPLVMAFNHVGKEVNVKGAGDNPHSLEAYLAGLEQLGRRAESLRIPGLALPESVESPADYAFETL